MAKTGFSAVISRTVDRGSPGGLCPEPQPSSHKHASTGAANPLKQMQAEKRHLQVPPKQGKTLFLLLFSLNSYWNRAALSHC